MRGCVARGANGPVDDGEAGVTPVGRVGGANDGRENGTWPGAVGVGADNGGRDGVAPPSGEIGRGAVEAPGIGGCKGGTTGRGAIGDVARVMGGTNEGVGARGGTGDALGDVVTAGIGGAVGRRSGVSLAAAVGGAIAGGAGGGGGAENAGCAGAGAVSDSSGASSNSSASGAASAADSSAIAINAAFETRGGANGAIGRDGLSRVTEGAAVAAPAPTSTDSGSLTGITPPQTEQRARTPPSGTFAGSTRKTDRQSGHVTFNSPPPRLRHSICVPGAVRPRACRRDGRW